ncbi:hypothetical protein PHLCEN_2v9612 [Hermanssonia centrifuga]|uniref:Uncharacterized protein n=1 Tax=Hermanssonia centrifuga TaxID=98765 RepID=A0A2R6NQA3_9APHY|nr:hypothetical protein PHLCEN_2v9612 [Hermanssonia centrifuga]
MPPRRARLTIPRKKHKGDDIPEAQWKKMRRTKTFQADGKRFREGDECVVPNCS